MSPLRTHIAAVARVISAYEGTKTRDDEKINVIANTGREYLGCATYLQRLELTQVVHERNEPITVG